MLAKALLAVGAAVVVVTVLRDDLLGGFVWLAVLDLTSVGTADVAEAALELVAAGLLGESAGCEGSSEEEVFGEHLEEVGVMLRFQSGGKEVALRTPLGRVQYVVLIRIRKPTS